MFALKIVAAGKAEEGGMERREFPHEIDTLAVRLVVVGGGKEWDQLEPCGPGALHEEFEMIGGRGSDVAGLECEIIFLPGAAEGTNGGGRGHLSAVVVDQTNGQFAEAVCFGVKGALVAGRGSEGHAPESGIVKAGFRLPAGVDDGELEAVRNSGAR